MMIMETPEDLLERLSHEEILQDYRIGYKSRQMSLVGRREVLSGRGKFGIFGDGKEVAQLAMARAFQKGDWRSGYYRDQTFMLALAETDLQELFALLYAHYDITAEPNGAGRQMSSHFASRFLNQDGTWKDQTTLHNVSADLSPTAGQMPRLVGLGYASKHYREAAELKESTQFSHNGNEVAFGTIGNASCAEGLFWEAINAIGVLGAPVVMSIWDDGYGISVPNEYQITKGNLSDLLQGFQRTPDKTGGFDIYTVRGWDYGALLDTYAQAAATARAEHVPAIIHVIEMTQPQGHSTSGSHERYKSKERLAFETDADCLAKMRAWMLDEEIVSGDELKAIEADIQKAVYAAKDAAWAACNAPIKQDAEALAELIEAVQAESAHAAAIEPIKKSLLVTRSSARYKNVEAAHAILRLTRAEPSAARTALASWHDAKQTEYKSLFNTFLHTDSAESATQVAGNLPIYSETSSMLSGFQILNAAFDTFLERDPRVLAFGEDLGQIGGVNQGFAGLQKKYGKLRVSDVGIREPTIIGQGLGMALRGLRPIAEIQYLDYVLYCLQVLSDDLASLHWRTAGGQKAPLIIRTRGHRLEGIWHAGSPMAGIINLIRGVHVCVPRDMVRAAGFYNTLLQGDEPGLVVEVLNGYRLKEKMPDNLAEVTIPLGVPDVIRAGEDVTVVTYGACCRVAMNAADMLAEVGIDTEVIDVQTLLPFDTHHQIVESLKKTSRIIFFDEDVPGGASAYMLQQVIEKQGGYHYLDSEPITLTSPSHRPAYGTDGGYFSKPSAVNLFTAVYNLMNEADPTSFPPLT